MRGIPAVKAFSDGRIVDEFTGALPPSEVERFFDKLVPSEADELAGSADDEESLRRALELEPGTPGRRLGLARILIGRGETGRGGRVAPAAPARLPGQRPGRPRAA